MVETQTLSFSITGEHLTEFFRGMVLDNQWDKAMKELPLSLGCTMDQALLILSGKQRLIGIDGRGHDGIFMEDDNDCDDYLETLNFQHASKVRIDGKWLQPYAVVTDYGHKDSPIPRIDFADDWDKNILIIPEIKHNSSTFKLTEFNSEGDENSMLVSRARHYMNSNSDVALPVRVMSEICHGIVEMFVLFEFCSPPPLWMDVDKTMPKDAKLAEAVKLAKELGKLCRVGHKDWYADFATRDGIRQQCMATGAEKDELWTQGLSGDIDSYDLTVDPMEQLAYNNSIAAAKRGKLVDVPKPKGRGLSVPTVDELFEAHRKADKMLQNLDAVREEILEQNQKLANGRMIKHDFGGDIGEVNIPEYPFRCWALRRTKLCDTILDWKTVCPMGMKATVDDPYHSDWMVGAGIDLQAYNDKDFNAKCFDMMHEFQENELGFDITILVNGGGVKEVTGVCVHPKANEEVKSHQIAIVPNASVRYYNAARTALAVVVANGGAMSHLAVTGLEEKFLIVMENGAKKKFTPGLTLNINAETGRIEIM